MARLFNGTSQSISAANTASALPVSISLWIYVTALTGNEQTPLDLHKSDGSRWMQLSLNTANPPKVQLRSYDGTTINGVTSGGTLSTGAWHNLVGTISTAGASIYLDGTGTAATFSSGAVSGLETIYIGQFGTSVNWTEGSLAEVIVWNGVLTDAEALALSQGVNARMIRPASIQGYWPLWGLASPEPDISGNANNGTVTGATAANHAPVTLWTRRPATAPLIQTVVAGAVTPWPLWQRMVA